MDQSTNAQSKVSEPRILKRQRSRPSDWWAAKPTNAPESPAPTTTPASIHVPAVKKASNVQDVGGKRKRGNAKSQPQAPETEVKSLKRQRSRPLKWWAANTSTASPGPASALIGKKAAADSTSSEEKGRKSGRGMQEVIGAGNRGRVGQAQDESEDTISKAGKRKSRADIAVEGGNIAPEKSKPSRRTRSSAGEEELQSLGVASVQVAPGGAGAKRKKRGRPTAARVQEGAVGKSALKKRGRPPAVRAEEQVDELLGEQIAAPKKKGRPSTGAAEKSLQQEPEKSELLTRRIGRSSGRVEDQDDDLAVELSGEPSQSSRGRPSGEPNRKDVAEEVPKLFKKRGRPSISGKGQVDVARPRKIQAQSRIAQRQSDIDKQSRSQREEEGRGRRRTRQSDVQADEEIRQRGRRRTRRSDIESHEVVDEPVVAGGIKPTKSGRRSEIIEVETASSKLTKNPGGKRLKPSGNVAPNASKPSPSQISNEPMHSIRPSKATSSAPSQIQKKGSRRPPQVKAAQPKRKGDDNTQSVPAKRQRIEQAREPGENAETAVDSVDYQHLEAVKKLVSRRTVETKWEALPPTGIDRISQLLGDLQHPVIARLKDERKKTQASTALEAGSRKIIKKLSQGLPFPPGTRHHREDDFDFEKILDHNRALEAQLTPTLHSNELLEAELGKEKARLEADMENLAELEKNAKAEAAMRNKAARKLHSVLQSKSSTAEIDMLKENIGLVEEKTFPSLSLGAREDEDLNALVKELNGHVHTIQGNIKQIHGVSHAIVRSRAAVQAALFENLDNLQYDDVVLGAD